MQLLRGLKYAVTWLTGALVLGELSQIAAAVKIAYFPSWLNLTLGILWLLTVILWAKDQKK